MPQNVQSIFSCGSGTGGIEEEVLLKESINDLIGDVIPFIFRYQYFFE